MLEIFQMMLPYGMGGNGLIAEAHGGLGMPWLTYAMMYDNLARVSGDVAISLLIQQLGAYSLEVCSNDAMRQKYLPRMVRAEIIACSGISEPGVGSNVAEVTCRARADGDQYIVSGEKTWISNGHYSDFCMVIVRTSDEGARGLSVILVDRQEHGYESRNIDKLGLNSTSTAQLFFDNVRVPQRNLIGQDITPALCYELVTLLGRMHVIGQSFPATRTNSMSFDAWEARLRRVNDHSTSKDTRKDARKDTAKPFLEELDFLKTHWPHNLPTGAIHADLFPDNVFIRNAHICGVIDFYFAATDYLAYDLAIVMNAWCFDTQITFCPDRWRSLLSGYESVRPLTPAEQSAYPLLCRGAALRFVASRLHDFVFHDPSHLVTPKEPSEYIEKLDFHKTNNLFNMD